MKKLWCLFLCAAPLVAQVYAQTTVLDRRAPPELVRVEGPLTLKNGFISVENEGVTYHIPALERFVGFIDGLKEGAAVSIEGYRRTMARDEKTAFLRPVKVRLNDKDYEFPAGPFADGPGNKQFKQPKRFNRDNRSWCTGAQPCF